MSITPKCRCRRESTRRVSISMTRASVGRCRSGFLAIAASGKAPQGLLDRMSVNGKEMPGHYTYAELPSTLWPPPVERGDYVSQETP